MRKIETAIITAIKSGKTLNSENTTIIQHALGVDVLLHGSLIARGA